MSLREEWQLKAHSPKMNLATALVALAVASRIDPTRLSVKIPQRTLLAESVAITSRNTISKALNELQALGVIHRSKRAQGSRNATLITWVLQCPENCQIDHDRGNARKSKAPTTRSPIEHSYPQPTPTNAHSLSHDTLTDWGALTKEQLREKGVLAFTYEVLQTIKEPTETHRALLSALRDRDNRLIVESKAEEIANSASSNWQSYLRKFIVDTPNKLLPKPLPEAQAEAQAREFREKRRAKLLAESEQFLEEQRQLEALSVPPPEHLKALLGLARN